ncbi:Os02g0253150 [Oryza sativa Japonica Group]|uniref:Os02g0253150 protein n=1 Tax=Oryza sativa subsp. japonica TaxID=39947 RepID=C7IZ03_ORYSJ|nr:Os02g0253150 [Oryza sativa Japonica Group]|eukprot:NP_001172879.1 Os02g0253150 [Oryza sativa Japonica Group]
MTWIPESVQSCLGWSYFLIGIQISEERLSLYKLSI